MTNYFNINNLRVDYQSYTGIKNVLDIEKLEIEKGESIGIVGESESGKSVLALTILRILSTPPGIIRSGEINLEGENLLTKSKSEMKKIRGRKIAMIFQDPMSTLNPVITVGQQIKNVLKANRDIAKNKLDEKTLEMIELVKLPDAKSIMHKYPHELSGGQRQRIIIALALSCGAELLLADEPTRNLDVTIQSGILKLINELKNKFNITVLFLTNNLTLVPAMCERLGVIYKGKIIELGRVREVIDSPEHPYTEMLIKAMPGKNKEVIDLGNLISRKGEDDGKISGGCPYYHRCYRRMDKCRTDKPVLQQIKQDHFVACHKIAGGENND